MPAIPNEVLSKLGVLQNQIWQTVSLTASESANVALNFSNPLTVVTPIADLYAEMGAPKLVIQFSFANTPENSQVILLTQETFAELVGLVKNEEITGLDDNMVGDVRPILESIVQGICVAVGNVRNEAIVATGLSTRFQIFSFPPNLQKGDDIVRTNIAFTGDGFSGSATWLFDSETAHAITGIQMRDEEATPFPGLGSGDAGSSSGGARPSGDDNGLDLLMDIPLEISVELGRVKMLVKDVVELGPGSIVEINKAAGEPVDVLVNGRLVARGEVVVIDDNFGVRITEILSPQDRLVKLNEAA